MSVQFGRWNFDGRPIDPEYVEKVNALLAPYAPDGHTSHSAAGVSMLYHAFHTTKESRRETQPHVCSSGCVITWDGRLDNRAELIKDLADTVTTNSTDVEIVAAAYEEWRENCFAKLIGDWALSVWHATTRSLLLARDPIGTRHLYYELDESRVTWSTILDPLVLLAGRRFELCEEYVAGWLGFFPATHLTPYIGIDSVPPSCFVRLRPGKREIHKYWDFDPRKRIRYHIDAEYEEHFRSVFAEAVCRRLRSDSPILAELSGGMDSSSIVCMADEIIARGVAETPRLDTVSYYDDSEPNWNERPYFTKVEEKRGRAGWQIDVGSEPFSDCRGECYSATPESGSNSSESAKQLAACIAAEGYRVVLSGVGGDEVTGGSPNPIPELMDFLARRHFRSLSRRLKLWALEKRRPWFHLFADAVREFLPAARRSRCHRAVCWLVPSFSERHWKALAGYPSRVTIRGPLPSFQKSLSTLEALRRQLTSQPFTAHPTREARYPYLDRTFLEFLFAVPREELVRPGQRRSLMRRALVHLVPEEILHRRRKAFVARSPLAAVSKEWPSLVEASREFTSASLGIVDPDAIRKCLEEARSGQQVPIVSLMRTFSLEFWLDGLIRGGILARAPRACDVPPSGCEITPIAMR